MNQNPEKPNNEIKTIKVGETYKTHVGDIVKIISIDKPNDRIHLFNISDGANQWVSLSRAIQHKLRTKVN